MSDKMIATKLRKLVANRANCCCEYCRSQTQFSIYPFSIDHIIPLSKGGESSLENLAYACQGCNNHKYNKTAELDPVSNKLVPLYNPRRQQWYDHFGWNYDFTIIIGTTPIGRATVELLRLNRESLINLRKILYKAGEHPPDLPEDEL